MAGKNLDSRVEVEDIHKQIIKERELAEKLHRKEKDEENRSYFSGQLDILERLESFIVE